MAIRIFDGAGLNSRGIVTLKRIHLALCTVEEDDVLYSDGKGDVVALVVVVLLALGSFDVLVAVL